MSQIKTAAEIENGEFISLTTPLEVVGKSLLFGSDTYSITLQAYENTILGLDVPATFELAIVEPEEMPDEEEILERVLALAISPGPTLEGVPVAQVLAWLVECNVFDLQRLIKLTNDLGPFEAEPARSCRVCGCTDQDCSQCIEASGEPCHWVAKDLCSRCQDELSFIDTNPFND